eukprot:3681511-Pleurochrysis_carterae.AAC.1
MSSPGEIGRSKVRSRDTCTNVGYVGLGGDGARVPVPEHVKRGCQRASLRQTCVLDDMLKREDACVKSARKAYAG